MFLQSASLLQQKTHKYREAKLRITSERGREKENEFPSFESNPPEHFMVVAAECMAIKDNLEYRNFQLQPLQAHAIVRVTLQFFLDFSFLFFLGNLSDTECIHFLVSWYTALFTHLSSWEKIQSHHE